MAQKQILFQFKDAVTKVGDTIMGVCYVRITDDLPLITLSLTFQQKEFSKIIQKRKIPFDANNPQMIPQHQVNKTQQIQISVDSMQEVKDENRKKYEIVDQSLYRIIRHYGNKETIVHTYELYSGQIKKGDYKFPFSLTTQPDMKSSFSYRSQDGLMQAKIRYKVTLNIEESESNKMYLQQSCDVFINQQYNTIPMKKQDEGNIVQFLCLNRGTVELSMQIAKNTFIPGEKLQIQYNIDNSRCQRAINRVEVRVINKITFIDDVELEHLVEKKKVLQVSFGGINAGIVTDTINVSVDLPKDLRATVKTTCIKNQYYLQIEAFADAFLTWLSVPVICQVPINIQESRLPTQVSLDGWNFVPIMQQSANVFSNMTVQQSYAH